VIRVGTKNANGKSKCQQAKIEVARIHVRRVG
jgi:hypothetical protein